MGIEGEAGMVFTPEVLEPTTYLGIYVWAQLIFLVSLGLFVMLSIALTRPRFTAGVLCVGYSYLVFVVTELLHFSGIVMHNQLDPSSLDHYGVPLFAVIASAGIVGSIGMMLAVAAVARQAATASKDGVWSEYCAECPALRKATELGEFAKLRREVAAKKIAANG